MSSEDFTNSQDERAPEVFPGVTLGDAFAEAVPELAMRWDAAVPSEPSLLILNDALAKQIGLDPEALRSEIGVRFLLGNVLAEGSTPAAQVYAGHQFGSYAPRLGDGRAVLLGDLKTPAGTVLDLHLKGSGRTPFSRGGDGFAAAGPMLREYLMSEAMHALGVPTTRSLAVVGTGRWVPRDEVLPGAVLTRVASSHLRVGSFQYARATGDLGLLRRLSDHAIDRHYPKLRGAANPPLRLLEAVIEAQAQLTAQWMLVGFVHGVLNTDNVTISGETIDYGPCAFIDVFDSSSVFSSIDREGRYAYGRQPSITHWNVTRLAETLLPLLSDDEEGARDLAVAALAGYQTIFDEVSRRGMRAKMGLGTSAVRDEVAASLASEMLSLLQDQRIDYTMFFRALALAARGDDAELVALFPEPAALNDWYTAWLALNPDAGEMDQVNPVYIPRNHLVDEALEAASDGDLRLFNELLGAVTRPFDSEPARERYALPAPAGSRPTVTTCGT